MENYIKRYKIKLKTLSPVFIGSGKEINKKEYVYYRDSQEVYIPDMNRLFHDILDRNLDDEYQQYLMSENMPQNCRITTIENYEKRIPIAKQNFVRAGKEKQITLLEGDAADILKELREPFDFIFMDAAKGQYIHFMPEILRLLKPEGILVSDNVLQDGDIIESHFIVTRRNRTIYKRMREYLYELTHSDELVTSVLPIGDGITVSVKK